MSKLFDALFALITYVCVATVITLALILGWCWHTDRLNGEKMFRLTALLQDVDLQQIAESKQKNEGEVPPEETSLNEVLHHQQVQDRNFEVKLLALQRGRQDFDYTYQELKKERDRYDRMAQDFQSKVKQQEELRNQENVATVVRQLEQVSPETGKELLLRWIEDKRMDDAIVMMSKMSETKLGKILKTFATDEELDTLHEIQERIVGGGEATKQLQEAIGDLNASDLSSLGN
jgi:3-methyladenine DNA glycosylase AlkC